MSLVKRNPKGKIVGTHEKKLIVNAYKDAFHKNTYDQSLPTLTKTKVAHSIVEELGFGLHSVMSTIIEYLYSGTLLSPSRKRTKKSTI